MELWIAGHLGKCGGALSETAHCCNLLRRHGVAVHLVNLFGANADAIEYADSIGCSTHEYRPDIFRDKIVASWNCGRFLSRLPELIEAGRPRKVIWMNCMSVTTGMELASHAAGWIDLFGFVSEYQRHKLMEALEPIAPVREFEGYAPFFDIDDCFQGIRYRYREPRPDRFVIGRISRDDPAKFPFDLWDGFERIAVPEGKKKIVRIMGFGRRAAAALREPPRTDTVYELLPQDAESTAEFLDSLDLLFYKPGPAGESYCRVIVEAMAAGVPVVSERNYAIPEIVQPGINGLLGDDSTQMATWASFLARHEGQRRRIIETARNFVKQEVGDPVKAFVPWKRLLTSPTPN